MTPKAIKATEATEAAEVNNTILLLRSPICIS